MDFDDNNDNWEGAMTFEDTVQLAGVKPDNVSNS